MNPSLWSQIVRLKKLLGSPSFVKTSIDRRYRLIKVAPISPEDVEREVAGKQIPSNIETSLDLDLAFPSSEVQPWVEGEFTKVKKLADASRNQGEVLLMQISPGEQLVAVKKMPNEWMQKSHGDFLCTHLSETEQPWQDIGFIRFLNSVNFKYACKLWGVYRSDLHTYVVSSFASEGDLFSAADAGEEPGLQREYEFKPIVFELFTALQQLHDLGIVRRDISLENVLRTKGEDGKSKLKLIDFGMAAKGRMFQNCARGKASYEAPEMQGSDEYDAFLSDTFATGVVVYAMLVKDYPWRSTRPGTCKCFDYVKQEGFRAYCANRCLRGSKKKISEVLSDQLLHLLNGMLSLDPKQRLTLGEKLFLDRSSVWDEPWMQTGFNLMWI